jgi:multiple sugar transport system substrate-binding protein
VRSIRTTRRLSCIVGLVAVGSFVAACGSDGASSSDASTPAAGSAAGGSSDTSAGGGVAPTGESISVMIAASGPAETAAVQAAVDGWQAESGNTVELIAAEDINLQLGQALAGGDPPDVFYVNADKFQEYAAGGSLAPVGSKLDNPDDFYESLRQVFTYDDELYCAPKDFSTLGLIINNASWAAAGLSDTDIPTTWEELATVAETLTTDSQVGLATGATRDRVGAFMVGAGGYFVNADQSEVTGDTPENTEALEYVQSLLDAGTYQFAENMSVGWGGEAFGKEQAAMVIEGNWIRGAMKNDYPTIDYTVAEIPAGPAGPGTMVFTQCWGVAQASSNQDAAVSFVNYMTNGDTQMALADAFGVMPSRESVREAYLAAYPDDAPFLAGADYGRGQVTLPAFISVLAEFDKGLLGLADGSADIPTVLGDLQTNGEDALGG